ncbi:MAG: MFS transporter [Chloroflexi bacterium]|nr:MFS transporter [Chloroflexota bacterium]
MKLIIRRIWVYLKTELVQPYPVSGCTSSQRAGMKWMWWDAIFATISASFYGDFVNLFLLELGARDFQIGLLSSIASAAAILGPLLGAWLVERSHKRKLWVLVGPGGGFRIAFFFIAALPFVMHGASAVTAFIVLYTLQSFASSLGMPAWNSLFADVVPIHVRGRYLGSSLTMSFVARLAIVPIAGVLVQSVGGLRGYQLVWLLAGLTGFIATTFYARIPEPPSQEVASEGAFGSLLGSLRVFAHDSRFLQYCVVTFVWNFGIQLAGPYFSVYQVQILGFSVDTIAFILTIASIVAAIVVRIAGELVDRFGAVKLMGVSMVLVPIIPVLWLLGRTPLQITVIQCIAEVAWAGFRVASTPLLLLLAPTEQRSRYIAANNIIASLALVLGPLPAGWLYSRYGFHTNLVVSAGGRALAAVLFILLVTLGSMRHMTGKSTGPLPQQDPGMPDA